MADNYLENKMEEHRRRQSAGGSRPATRHGVQPSVTRLPAHSLVTTYPQLRVVVTGGASGTGRAIVEAFRSIDAQVDFCDIDQRRGAATAQATGARFHPLDAGNADSLKAMISRVIADRGDIDVVVNNVGICRLKPQPPFVIARELARHREQMSQPNPYGGRIINIGSSQLTSSLTHSLMVSLAPWHITVNCISPGRIDCCIDHEQHPGWRMGSPADVARLALFLARPDSDFINGADIPVDGGMTHCMYYEP